jgi:hypothetical protein
MGADLAKFISRWEGSSASEQQTKDLFLVELCDELGVARPEPASGDPSRDRYVFEYPVREKDQQGKVHTKRIDLYKEGHFLLEAKQGAAEGATKAGTAKRGTNAWHIAMNEAYGQALGYARIFAKPVPILVVCDIGYCFDIYESFDGSGAYRHFPTAQTNRLYLRDLEKHVDTLRRVFTEPLSLDPSRKAAKVTQQVAEYLANLAKKLEEAGHAQETVARFLMRCLFTMFAEDIELLPDHLFTRLLREHWIPHPRSFPGGVQALWEKMNTGGDMVLASVRRFNGGLFGDTAALPLDDHALRLLLLAAEHDWSDVEPAIFGTLLERALDKRERHRLGAHYTPRAYVERLVRPTIEEPLRAEWDVVRAEVAQLRVEEEKTKSTAGKKKKRTEAIQRVRAFHKKLCEIRVLDPACGSGNFLYVALHLFQQIESEIWSLLESLGESQDVLRLEGLRVTPAQFLGIEKKRWAKEIAELVLWIGYLQWHYRMLGKRPPVFEPVLHDYKNIENRDAVLAYDQEEMVLDERGRPIMRWDGETTKIHPVTKKEVPDETATVPVYQYLKPRKAEWPKADYVIGNPPFLGTKRMRAALGDGYVDALRGTYADAVEDSADLVMYWWHRAAELAETGALSRFGLITTNSITQSFNRRVLERHIERGLTIAYAIPDHPWTDAETGAAVRIAMTCGTAEKPKQARLALVVSEGPETESDEARRVLLSIRDNGPIQSDLRMGADVTAAVPLRGNAGISGMGVALHGHGFVLAKSELPALGLSGSPVVRSYLGGRDLLQVPRERYVIDFSFLSEEDARAASPAAFQHLTLHVLPERSQNRRDSIRLRWWRFGWERPRVRKALEELPRYIGTTETAKHRVFQFIPGDVLPDHMIVVIASSSAFVLGVLSSTPHLTWALSAGGTLEDRPRYNKNMCFDPFPFPDPAPAIRLRISTLAESLDAHRKARQAAHPDLTVTGMYNVLEKLRTGESLNDKETAIHDKGLVSVLKKIHDDLDTAVFEAYGWLHDLTDEQILEKLVALNAERAEEEKQGTIRWLRPDFQNPSGKAAAVQGTIAATEGEDTEEAAPVVASTRPWPKKLAEQIGAARDLVTGGSGLWTANSVAAAFSGAKPADVVPVLESLAMLGHLLTFGGEDDPRWKAVKLAP